MNHTLCACVLSLGLGGLAWSAPEFVRPPGVPDDVRPEYHNRAVTALVEDSESVRLALGAAWDDALACRSYAGYLAPWSATNHAADAEALIAGGARLYELVKCVDDGIESVRLARDTRDEPRLLDDVKFWRNELARAAREVTTYGDQARELKAQMEKALAREAAQRGLATRVVEAIPWMDSPEREAWRQAGSAVGVRLPVEPHTNSFAAWWDRNLSFEPGYLPAKLASAGARFIAPETPVGAWGGNCIGPGQYDWTTFDLVATRLRDRRCGMLLELPTLQAARTAEQIGADRKKAAQNGWSIYCPEGVPPMLPAYLANDPAATLAARGTNGALSPHGAVQLFNPAVAAAYGDYLKALAAHLKAQKLYDTVQAIHLEMGDWADLPESVDYSDLTRARWQAFLATRHGDVSALNDKAGTNYASFADVAIPAPPYPPVLAIDYLWFRRAWVRDYLAVKRGLVAAAFPDKLIIAEMRQFGDHDGMSAAPERKWGGFLGEDIAQWSGVGPHNERNPFMIRSVGAVGFGTRPSDSLESLFRDYLWLDFRDPGNLTRYFYHWVAHGYMDYQLGWHSVGNHWLSNKLVYELGPTVANTAPEPQPIGLLLPRATFDLTNGAAYFGYAGWDWMLQAAKLPYTRVDERLVREGGLAGLGLRVLVMPAAPALEQAVADAIAAWVEQGGVLLAEGVPGAMDEYGRPRAEPALARLLGATVAGTTCEAVNGTPLTVTVPHGHYSGRWQAASDRKPVFAVLAPSSARVLATYESGKPALTVGEAGKGRAYALGYPFGTEAVECERTSIGFQRTYVWFVREPQLVARAEWLRGFFERELGLRPEYGVDYAEVERIRGVEEIAPGFHMPKGLTQDPADPFFIRTVGDPRPDHAVETVRETPDLALRFFPRQREGLATRYLGISTREVHYLGPRAAVQMLLARHTYRCRIENPRIQALWDVARNVPVGFERDTNGVAFTVSLPSGHVMMLAVSETTNVDVFAAAPFPGREKNDVRVRCMELAGGKRPPKVAVLTPDLRAWAEDLAQRTNQAVVISYGQPANLKAAEMLADGLRSEFGLRVELVEQAAKKPAAMADSLGNEWQAPVVFIGDDWTNNDLAMHGAYWGIAYGAHLPFTATYAWPGEGRAVVSLSRRYALTGPGGGIPFQYMGGVELRPVQPTWPLQRRKLTIAANGPDAEAAVEAVIKRLR